MKKLPPIDVVSLCALSLSGGSLSFRSLVEVLGASPDRVALAVDNLVKLGLVRLVKKPGAPSHAALTVKGEELAQEYRATARAS